MRISARISSELMRNSREVLRISPDWLYVYIKIHGLEGFIFCRHAWPPKKHNETHIDQWFTHLFKAQKLRSERSFKERSDYVRSCQIGNGINFGATYQQQASHPTKPPSSLSPAHKGFHGTARMDVTFIGWNERNVNGKEQVLKTWIPAGLGLNAFHAGLRLHT